MLVGLLALSAMTALGADAADDTAPTAVEQGRLQNKQLTESSGLVASRLTRGVLWTVNDSGHDPAVFAIGERGEDLAQFRVLDVGRGDWEDIGTASLNGTDVLVIGDIGDNLSQRHQRALHVIPEPAVSPERRRVRGELRPLRTVRYRYPDGAHDCEAMAVEPDGSQVVLVVKTWWGAAAVFSVSLAAGKDVRVAQPLGNVPIAWATAGAMASDGRAMLIGTYSAAFLFRRGVGEPWGKALARAPVRIPLPTRPQGEGLTFSADGRSLFASSEGAGSVLWRIPLAAP